MRADIRCHGMCLWKPLREVGDLSNVVPQTDLVKMFSRDLAYNISTDKLHLYLLDAFPAERTTFFDIVAFNSSENSCNIHIFLTSQVAFKQKR